MEELITYRSDLLSALEGAVDKLSITVARLPTNAWNLPIQSDGRTPHYILFHLYALYAQVFTVQLPHILAEETPRLPIFDDEAWMADHHNPEEPALNIMEEIRSLHQHELGWLRELSPQGWSRTARHPWWGVHTLQWYVELQLELTNQHLKSLTALIPSLRTCPCCGYKSFQTPDPGSFEICPICYWEDDRLQANNPDLKGGANRPSLRQAQRNFLAFGACEKRLIRLVRKPTSLDERDPSWKPIS